MPEQITFRREDDGRWRWLYVNPEADVELRSSKTYASATEARLAAADLYPGVALEEVTEQPAANMNEFAPRKLLRQAVVASALLMLLFRALKKMGADQSPDALPSEGRRSQHRGVHLGESRPPLG